MKRASRSVCKEHAATRGPGRALAGTQWQGAGARRGAVVAVVGGGVAWREAEGSVRRRVVWLQLASIRCWGRVGDGGVGEGGLRQKVSRAVALASAARRLGKLRHRSRALRAMGLGHPADSHEAACLDVGQRNRVDLAHH